MKLIAWLKEWALIIAIIAGIAGYFVYVHIPFLQPTHHAVNKMVAIVQPLLIFCMLFLTFCKINPRKLRFCAWHGWLLLVQAGLFLLLSVVLLRLPQGSLRVVIEGAAICLICPTATAAAVITRKMGGDVAHITSYTILINIAVALLIPAVVPLVHPNPELNMLSAALLIIGKVFPLLLLPLVAAFVVRRFFPRVHFVLSHYPDLSFYLWLVALALAMAVTTRSIVHSNVDLGTECWLVVVSLVCCVMQFYVGRKIGARYQDKVTAGQALGQKNTVLAIWMGYTFFTPITAIVGGFYSVWHNVINSWQLHEHHKQMQAKKPGGDTVKSAF